MREFFKGTKINIKRKLGLNNFGFKKISLIFLLLVLFFTPLDNFKYLTGFTQIPAFAGEIEDKQQELYNLQKQIQDLNNSLSEKRQQEQTLAGEIAIMDDQIKAIELEIQSTQMRIDQTQAQIDELNQRIAEIEKEIERQKEVLGEHIRVLYEEGQISTLEIIASSDSFSDFVNRSEYLETMQQTIKEAIDKIKVLKAELDAKKQDLVNQQNQLTELRNQQEAQRQGVEAQRSAKQVLLDQTKGEEVAFQAQLTDTYAKQRQADYELAMMTGTSSNRNTAQKDGRYFGYFTWPLNSYSVSQGYGMTDYALSGAYGGLGHNGIDIYWYEGAPIVAAAGGTVRAGYGYNGGWGNWVAIYHPNGLTTLYGHLKTINVAPGSYVNQGQIIGAQGGNPRTDGANAGSSTGSHLHFSAYWDFWIWEGTNIPAYNYEGTLNPFTVLP